jgi:hypothetical protein
MYYSKGIYSHSQKKILLLWTIDVDGIYLGRIYPQSFVERQNLC